MTTARIALIPIILGWLVAMLFGAYGAACLLGLVWLGTAALARPTTQHATREHDA